MNSETQNNRFLLHRVVLVYWLWLIIGGLLFMAATSLALWIVGFEAFTDAPVRWWFMLGTVVGFSLVVIFASRAAMRVMRDAKLGSPSGQDESKRS